MDGISGASRCDQFFPHRSGDAAEVQRGGQCRRAPFIREIGIKELMLPDVYARNFFKHMRLHYQFVMGNEQRAQYDFYMFVCGPVDFDELSEASNGPLDLFDSEGFAADGTFTCQTAVREKIRVTPACRQMDLGDRMCRLVSSSAIRTNAARARRRSPCERSASASCVLMIISACGLGVIPLVYVLTGLARIFQLHISAVRWRGLGSAMFVASLVLVLPSRTAISAARGR